MKEFLYKVLHVFNLDVLLMRLFEKLLAGLNKKYTAFQNARARFLCCHATATVEMEL